MARPYWQSEERWRSRGLLALLIVLLLGQTAFSVLFNHQTGEFTSALAAQDADRFWSAIRACLLLLAAAVPIYGLYYYVRDTVGLRWRKWMTTWFLDRYFAQRTYYRSAPPRHRQPDQRIAEDINAFTSQSLYFSMIVLSSVIQLILFQRAVGHLKGLVYFLIGYAIVSTLFTATMFGKAHRGQLSAVATQADFPLRPRACARTCRAIAFHRGEAREGVWLKGLSRPCMTTTSWCCVGSSSSTCSSTHSFLTVMLPNIIIAGDVLSGELEVGKAVQAAGAFSAILSALTVIVEHFEGPRPLLCRHQPTARFFAGTRVQADRELARTGRAASIGTEHGVELALQHLTVYTQPGALAVAKPQRARGAG